MKILLSNTPNNAITIEQRNTLIKSAKEWDADYLTYANELDGVHYFLFGVYKDKRPRFWGFPHFVYFNGNKVIAVSNPICLELMNRVESKIFNLSSTD